MFKIQFNARCETRYGENVYICGNHQDLGGWAVKSALRLFTNDKTYPHWNSRNPISVKSGDCVEFKLCIVDQATKVVRWQQLKRNRQVTPRDSIIIQFVQSQPELKLEARVEEPKLVVRKRTVDILNDLDSDDSSNKQFWREQMYDSDEDNSGLLTLLKEQMHRLISSHNAIVSNFIQMPQLQPEASTNSLGLVGNRLLHYLLLDDYDASLQCSFIRVPKGTAGTLTAPDIDIAVVHCRIVSSMDSVDISVSFSLQTSNQNLQIYKVVHVETEISRDYCERNLFGKVNMLIVHSYEQMNQLLRQFEDEVLAVQKNVFVLTLPACRLCKVAYCETSYEQLQTKPQDEFITKINRLIKLGEYFGVSLQAFERGINARDSLFRSLKKTHCLILLQIDSLDDVTIKSIRNMVDLSQKRNITVYILLKQKFPNNIRKRIPASSHDKIIFINTVGEIYCNGEKTLSLFDLLELHLDKFMTNLKAVKEVIGCDFHAVQWTSHSLILTFAKDTLGALLKSYVLRQVAVINSKSVYRLSVSISKGKLQIMPFCLHPKFLYCAVTRAYVSRLRVQQHGIIINISNNPTPTSHYILSSLRIEPFISITTQIKCVDLYLSAQPSQGTYRTEAATESMLQKLVQTLHRQINQDNTMVLPQFNSLIELSDNRDPF